MSSIAPQCRPDAGSSAIAPPAVSESSVASAPSSRIDQDVAEIDCRLAKAR